MEKNLSDLVLFSKNKYNINLLETIEHKELFKNLNHNLRNKTFNKSCNIKDNNRSFLIKEEEYQGKENKHLNFENRSSIKKTKISSKSFNNNAENQINNFNEIFNKLSPKKNKRCLTQTDSQNNEYDLKVKKKLKKNNSFIGNKLKNNNSLKQKEKINIKNFIFERSNNTKDNNYFDIDYIKDESKCYFKEGNKNNFIINNTNLDVYNRLYNKSYYYKKKNNIITNEENNCTFNPQLLSSVKNNECLDNFIKRQEQFNSYIKQKKINLKKFINNKESKKFTFTPNTSCTSASKYSIKLEAQRQDESNLDKTNRLVYDSIKKIQEKNNHLKLIYNTQYTFIPCINKNTKKIINNKNNNINNLYYYKQKKTKENNNDIKEKINIEKYINHQYDNIKSNYKNDNELMNRLKEENIKRMQKIDNIRQDQENEIYEIYTFKPVINKNNNINNFHNSINYFYNKNPDSYVDYYNKKKYFENKNRSHSHNCSKNNLYINNNMNYNYNNNDNNYNNYNNNDNNYNNNYNNYNNNYNNYNNYDYHNLNCNNFDRPMDEIYEIYE